MAVRVELKSTRLCPVEILQMACVPWDLLSVDSGSPRSPEFILFIKLFIPVGQCQGIPGPNVPGLYPNRKPQGFDQISLFLEFFLLYYSETGRAYQKMTPYPS